MNPMKLFDRFIAAVTTEAIKRADCRDRDDVVQEAGLYLWELCTKRKAARINPGNVASVAVIRWREKNTKKCEPLRL